MAQRTIWFTFTGTAKLNRALAPIPKRYTILHTANECAASSSLVQVTAKPAVERKPV